MSSPLPRPRHRRPRSPLHQPPPPSPAPVTPSPKPRADLHKLFPLTKCPKRDMSQSPYVLSGPFMDKRRTVCFKVDKGTCGGRRELTTSSSGSGGYGSGGGGDPNGKGGGRKGGRKGGLKGGKSGSSDSCCNMQKDSIEFLINPVCASPKALAGITFNGAKVTPAFSTGTFRGTEYGIVSVSVWVDSRNSHSAAAVAAASSAATTATNNGGGDDSWPAPLATVCFRLKRKGPCSSAAQFCYGGQCVFAAVDAERECCPTSPITTAQ